MLVIDWTQFKLASVLVALGTSIMGAYGLLWYMLG